MAGVVPPDRGGTVHQQNDTLRVRKAGSLEQKEPKKESERVGRLKGICGKRNSARGGTKSCLLESRTDIES